LAGKYKKATDAFHAAINLKYTESKVYNNLGLALANIGRYSEALEAFKKGGGEARAYNNLGCIYLRKGKFEEAIQCFEKAIEIQPGFYAGASENLKKAKARNGQL
jgi:tetratricopeptide (TPR) repeat protein